MSLDEILDVVVSIESAGIVAAGFGVPGIFGTTQPDGWGSDRYRYYTKPADMLDDGFEDTDPEYVLASALMSQELVPRQFLVGRRLTPVAQVTTITPTAHDDTTYTFSINGRTVTYTSGSSATATTISDGLRTALTALDPDEPVTGTGTSTVVLTANEAGIPFTVAEDDSNLAVVTGTANVGITSDLADVREAGGVWYGTLLTSRDADVIRAAAAWTEANSSDVPSILIAQTSDAAVRDSAYDEDGTDIGDILKAYSYRRTNLWWHDDNDEALDAAVAGRLLPEDPGTESWALKKLAGVPASTWSQTQKNNAAGATPGAGKNVNGYWALTPANNITKWGTMSSGDWIDLIRLADFLKARISEGIADVMLKNKKIPMNDDGIAMLANPIRGVLQKAKNDGKIDDFTLTVPDISEVSAIDRAARTLLNNPITWSAKASGAIITAAVRGTISQ